MIITKAGGVGVGGAVNDSGVGVGGVDGDWL